MSDHVLEEADVVSSVVSTQRPNINGDYLRDGSAPFPFAGHVISVSHPSNRTNNPHLFGCNLDVLRLNDHTPSPLGPVGLNARWSMWSSRD